MNRRMHQMLHGIDHYRPVRAHNPEHPLHAQYISTVTMEQQGKPDSKNVPVNAGVERHGESPDARIMPIHIQPMPDMCMRVVKRRHLGTSRRMTIVFGQQPTGWRRRVGRPPAPRRRIHANKHRFQSIHVAAVSKINLGDDDTIRHRDLLDRLWLSLR